MRDLLFRIFLRKQSRKIYVDLIRAKLGAVTYECDLNRYHEYLI